MPREQLQAKHTTILESGRFRKMDGLWSMTFNVSLGEASISDKCQNIKLWFGWFTWKKHLKPPWLCYFNTITLLLRLNIILKYISCLYTLHTILSLLKLNLSPHWSNLWTHITSSFTTSEHPCVLIEVLGNLFLSSSYQPPHLHFSCNLCPYRLARMYKYSVWLPDIRSEAK